jgi:hypothetical protein
MAVKITLDDVPRLLETLECGDMEAREETLGLLCPCRNRVYDGDIWRAIFQTYQEADMAITVRGCKEQEPVRNRARHAIETLHEHATFDPRAKSILDGLAAQGIDTQVRQEKKLPTAKAPETPRQTARITWRDVPRLLETLSCGDESDRKQTLELLCPCRNRRYDKEVWLSIFDAYRNAEGVGVRDQAGHAIGTLFERARTDPRSQELLRWLEAQGVVTEALNEKIPTWIPNLRGNGLYIPRYEHSTRSKANRRR